MDIIDLLAQDNFIIYNKDIAKEYGVEVAILLGAMCGYQKGFKQEFFYREQEKIIEDTALTLYSVRFATKKLIELGLLEMKKMGMPAKHYYKINIDNLFNKCFRSRPNENGRSRDYEICRTTSEEINRTNNNNEDKNNIIYNIVEYLNQKAGTHYKATTPKTKQFIKARLNEKFTEDDFKIVIDKKCNEWLGTDMEQYLRPETLFGTKFESYLNQKASIKIPPKQEMIRNNYQKTDILSYYTDLDKVEI